MFSTKDVKRDGGFVSSFATFGINQFKIAEISVKSAKRPGTYMLYFKLETPPVEDSSFKPVDDAKGQICNVGVYLTTEPEDEGKSISSLMKTLGTIADKLGVNKEVDEIKEDTLEAYILKYSKAVVGEKYAWYKLTATEYTAGKFRLNFARFNFCKSVNEVVLEDIKRENVRGRNIITELPVKVGKAMLWDKDVSYDFKPYEEPTPTDDSLLNAKDDPADDLPFGKINDKAFSTEAGPDFLRD